MTRSSIDRRTLLTALAGLIGASTGTRAQTPLPFLAAYERASGGRIGLLAENVATGARLAWRADERFALCSTFKASLAAFVLARVDRGADRLDAAVPFGEADLQPYAPAARANLAAGAMSVEAMARAIVEISDNTCANVLLRRVGGPPALTAFWRGLGDATSRLDHDEPQLNRTKPGELIDTTTPAAMAATLRRLVLGDGLAPASRARLADWMVACSTGANRLRAGLPKDWRIGDKTGNNGADAMGDIAVCWPGSGGPIVICAYTQGGAPDAAMLLDAFSAVGREAARLRSPTAPPSR